MQVQPAVRQPKALSLEEAERILLVYDYADKEEVEAYLTNVASNTKGEIQKYTVLAAKDEQSEYGYIVEKIKLKK